MKKLMCLIAGLLALAVGSAQADEKKVEAPAQPAPIVVQQGCGAPSCAPACCEPVCCTELKCKRVCSGCPEVKKEKRHCWKTECKEICIPRVTFPWQRPCCCNQGCCNQGCCDCDKGYCPPLPCCDKVCGRPKCVTVLKKHKYECDKYEYKWNFECCCKEVPAKCCKTSCCTTSCGSSCCGSAVALPPAATTAPAEVLPMPPGDKK